MFSVIFPTRTPLADMEGFLRSSFLLRLVSFPLLPFRITGRVGVENIEGLISLVSCGICPMSACTFLCAHVFVHLKDCPTEIVAYLPKLCVRIVFMWCVAETHAYPYSLESDWKHTSTTWWSQTHELSPPLASPLASQFKWPAGQALCVFILHALVWPFCSFAPALLNTLIRVDWLRQSLANQSCDVLLFSVSSCVCLHTNVKIRFFFCLSPSWDSN